MSDVKCHICGEFYSCSLHDHQGFCAGCTTQLVMKLKPGSKIKVLNDIWIRMEDLRLNHLEGFLLNQETGACLHTSRVIYDAFNCEKEVIF